MKEINVIFTRTKSEDFTGIIKEHPEFEIKAHTLREAQSRIYHILLLLYGKYGNKKMYNINITMNLNIR